MIIYYMKPNLSHRSLWYIKNILLGASKNKTCVAATDTHNKFIAYTIIGQLETTTPYVQPALFSADRYYTYNTTHII